VPFYIIQSLRITYPMTFTAIYSQHFAYLQNCTHT